MDTLPPVGSLRRRAALAFFLVVTSVFAYFLLHGLVDWITKGRSFPFVRGFISVAYFAFIWQWITQELRKPQSSRSAEPPRAA